MPLIDPVTMSTSISKASKAQAPKYPSSASLLHPQLLPTQTFPTPTAQTARHALPALQAALFIYRFKALVANPVSTMTSTLPLVAVIQAAYTLTCLPVAGSARPGRKHRPGEKKNAGGGPNVFVAIALSLLLSLSITPFFHLTMVLFGAPVLTHLSHTLLCAAHISILALFPLFYVHGIDADAWIAVAGFRAPFDEAFGGLAGAVLGAWLGAVPIPLDWDREWQKWPVTILCGIYLGYLVGKVVGGTLAFGKKF